MKKVLYIAHLQSHIRNFHLAYLKHLQDRGFYVAVATRVDNPEELAFLDEVIDFPFVRSPFTLKTADNYRDLKKLFIKGNYDIIHCHTPVAGITTRLAAHAAKVKSKVYYTAHGFHFFTGAPLINWLIYYPAEWLCAKYTDVLFTMNQEDYQRAKAKFKHPEVVYIHGAGIDTSKYNVAKNIGKHLELVTVGEMIKRKNQLVLIQAVEQIKDIDCHLTIAGDGELRSDIEKYINDHHLNDKVSLIGHVKPVTKAFENKDMFLFSSLHEGLPVAVMEAMACGLPCIVSNVRGNNDLIDAKGGMLINNTVHDFVSSIKTLYNDKQSWNLMGTYNQNKVQMYSNDIVFSELDKFYID